MTMKALVIGVVLVRALVIGVVLVLAALFSPAHADEGNGRYVMVPVPGHEMLILLDTKTGQNWVSKTTNQIAPLAERPRVFWYSAVFHNPGTLLPAPNYLPPRPPTEQQIELQTKIELRLKEPELKKKKQNKRQVK